MLPVSKLLGIEVWSDPPRTRGTPLSAKESLPNTERVPASSRSRG